MLKNLTKLEHKIGDRVYSLLCEMDSPLSDVKDSLFQFIKYIAQIEDQLKAQQESSKPQQSNEPIPTPDISPENVETPKEA